MQLHGCKVWITCDGQPLPEYSTKIEGDDGKTISSFVPSEAGNNFALHYHNNCAESHPDHLLYFAPDFDGTSLRSSACRQWAAKSVKGHRPTATTELPLQFATLVTTDEEITVDSQTIVELGLIRVRVSRVRQVPIAVPTPRTYKQFSAVGPVHERSKKAGSHRVSLGTSASVKPWPAHRHEYRLVDRKEGYIAVFLFRYRPLALLQAQGIAPLLLQGSPAAPSQSLNTSDAPGHVIELADSDEEDRSGRPAKRTRLMSSPNAESSATTRVKAPASDDEDDVDLLKSQMQQIQERLNRAEKKKSLGQSSSGGSRRVKKEERRASPKLSFAESDGVIDLTLSD